jgi:hypothetical protein
MSRRFLIGLALSIAAHAVFVGTYVGAGFLRDATPSRVEIDVMGMHLEELKDLPLGAPTPGKTEARPRPQAQAPASQAKEGSLATKEERAKPKPSSDVGDADEGGANATDLRQLGPEGARFTLLLRVDRLKGTPFAEPVDALLMRMPDRRDLLEGTGLSLYEDFEALLVSTPNPMDYRVTFLAARHRASDATMRSAIDRGARATGRTVAWRKEGGRPWGDRRASASATSPADPLAARDERIIVLPAPGLVVVTPPTYRALLLAPQRKPAVPDGGVATADAGAVDAGATPASWTTLLRRIDAEDGLLGPNAVAMASAVDLFKARGGAPIAFLGVALDIPRFITIVLGLDPQPYVELTGEYESEDEARRWETTWPTLLSKLRSNPYVVVGGFSRILNGATSEREGKVVKVRIKATTDETSRLLRLAAGAIP